MKNYILCALQAARCRGVWNNAIVADAVMLVNAFTDAEIIRAALAGKLEKLLLNGARNWREYSYSGSALIYDTDIARRYCTKTELQKTKSGERQPNTNETWLDVQARALWQAARLILQAARGYMDE